ncbi:XRE family transcriptional regulator [Streptomyces phaeochromogenes]|uniref:XRE family transcriptional regulator n=1 Tax=Streptomyces phaeochromogenes TaxID=1923 RepID=UPI00386B9D0E|nr:XRE family transcriptional regulator [Streptomyces phaeochromogenes]
MGAAVAQVMAVMPAVGEEEATAVLEAAVPMTIKGPDQFLEELAEHMAAQPDALTSGDSRCPPVLLRLAHVLHEAGHQVVRPGCAHCGTVRTDLRQLRAEGRICGTCDRRSRKNGTCGRCGATGVNIVAKRPEGGICNACYRVDPEVVEECAECGKLRCPAQRLPDGRALCRICWKRPMHSCVSCGKTAAAALIDEQGAYCHLCYSRRRRPRRPCGRCGRLGRIARNAHDGMPDLCDGCYRGPERTCSRCGCLRPCTRTSTDEPICHSCYARDERPLVPCARCQRDKPVMTHWPIGPVCQSCYTAIVRNPAECARCHDLHPLIAQGEDGLGLCGPCAGHDVDYTCRQCGRSGNPYGRGRCAHCVLADKVNNLLAGPDGAIPAQLQPLADGLTSTHTPFKTIQWVHEHPNAKLLAALVAGGREIDHAVLDELPPGAALQHLRQMMVQTGVLPERHEDLERVAAWLEHHLDDKPVEHATLVRPFLHWHLLRRARTRASKHTYPTVVGRDLRRRILVALDLLAWIDTQETTLAELRQGDLDRWLDGEKTQRRNRVRYFLGWTADRGLSRRLSVPSIPRQEPADLLDDDQRWQLLQRCLTDEALPIEARAAGALIILFALQAQRIRHLTADHLTENGDDAYLTAGRHPLLLPPRLGALLRELASRPPTPLMIPHGPKAPRWLFPGRVPGQPLDGHSLTNLLNRHGISTRPARNGALMALAADLPAAILADLLGLHVNTAVRWVTYARRDWADYLATRLTQDHEQSSDR